MYNNFKEQAIEYVRQAVAEDNEGNYAKVFPLYMNALEYFKTHLKYEKNPKIKEDITQKFTEYFQRADEIRAMLDDAPNGPTAIGDAAVQAKPKLKNGKKGDGGDGDGDGDNDGVKAAENERQAQIGSPFQCMQRGAESTELYNPIQWKLDRDNVTGSTDVDNSFEC